MHNYKKCLTTLFTLLVTSTDSIALDQPADFDSELNQSINFDIGLNQSINYDIGRESFEKGKYRNAIVYFNNALLKGMESPGLYYSLASAYYRAGDYKTSKKYFQMLTSDKQFGALAHYNLGLIAHKFNDTKTAIQLFTTAKKLTPNKTLKKLSSKQINTLIEADKSRWSNYISMGYGYDSNITSSPDNLATNESGSFVRAFALVEHTSRLSKYKSINTEASLFISDYFNTDDSDDKLISINLGLKDKIKKWKFDYKIGVKQSTYGPNDYQRIYLLTLAAKNKLRDRAELLFEYRYEDINSLNTRYDYLHGSRQKLRAKYRKSREQDRFQLQYELELNNRNNTSSENYSPTRHKFVFKYDNKITINNIVGGEIEYRSSSYAATTTQDRSDNRISIAIKHSLSFANNWYLKSRVKHKINNSNEPDNSSDYNRTITTIDLSHKF